MMGKSLLVVNLALLLAARKERAGIAAPVARRVLMYQFELPTPTVCGASSQATVELRFQFRYAAQQPYPRRSAPWAARPVTTSCAGRSWISPIVPNAPRNRPSPSPAASGVIVQADGQYRPPL